MITTDDLYDAINMLSGSIYTVLSDLDPAAGARILVFWRDSGSRVLEQIARNIEDAGRAPEAARAGFLVIDGGKGTEEQAPDPEQS